MRDPLRRVTTAGLALLAPVHAHAQAASGVDTTPGSTWRFQVSADGTWYENAYFVGVPDSEWSTGGQATLSRQQRFRTGSFSLSGFGGAIYYPEIDGFNQPTYGGSFSLGWSASRRTRLSLAQGYSRTNTRTMSPLTAEGLPLPTSGLNNATSTVGLEQQLAQRWQLGLDGGFTYRRYDDERLVGGEELSAGAQLAHSVGRNSSFYLRYAYSASWIQTGRTGSHQALLGVRRRPEHGLSLELAGGVGYLESTEAFYPTGRATLSAHGRRSSVTLGYYRDFGQAFGYGRQTIADIASATLSWTPKRRLSFTAGYNFGYRRDPADEAYTIVSSIASAGFNWDVGGGVGFGASYGWERNETQGQPVVEGGRATASLSYGVDWR